MEKDIIKKIAEVVEVPAKEISMDSNLVKDLDLESLDVVTLVAEFEREYDIYIDDKDIKNFQTVKDVVDYIKSKIKE